MDQSIRGSFCAAGSITNRRAWLARGATGVMVTLLGLKLSAKAKDLTGEAEKQTRLGSEGLETAKRDVIRPLLYDRYHRVHIGTF